MVKVKRYALRLQPDHQRIITRFHFPGEEIAVEIIHKVLLMPAKIVTDEINSILRDFSKRHRSITSVLIRHFLKASQLLENKEVRTSELTMEQKLLIGAYFTSEYALESAAFFNPSVVEHPDQSFLETGHKRILLSFRATGEGHISSIVFREGVITDKLEIQLEDTGFLDQLPEKKQLNKYVKETFLQKLEEMHVKKPIISTVMDLLKDPFSNDELRNAIQLIRNKEEITITKEKVLKDMLWLADSSYEISFSKDISPSERVLFPISKVEQNGLEDARFVKFTEDDGKIQYYATYTAYNGFTILPRLLSTTDFYTFQSTPLYGKFAQNKDMALFPRKINGYYHMIARVDGHNIYVLKSQKVDTWNKGTLLQKPVYPWELVRIGNSGSPIETKEGWLMLSHGVGPMHRYCIGASLLDLENPAKVISRLKKPLMIPIQNERDGYVPNVLFTCGAIIHQNQLIIPYGMSDYASSFASVSVEELLNELK